MAPFYLEQKKSWWEASQNKKEKSSKTKHEVISVILAVVHTKTKVPFKINTLTKVQLLNTNHTFSAPKKQVSFKASLDTNKNISQVSPQLSVFGFVLTRLRSRCS